MTHYYNRYILYYTYSFHYWERCGLLTSTQWAALPRHADEVDTWRQTVYFRTGGHSIHAHTCQTWSGICKPAAALCVLLSFINTTWGGKLSHWEANSLMFIAFLILFTSTARTAGSWISHLMHTRELGALRNCTVHLTCLQKNCGSALLFNKGGKYGGEENTDQVRPCRHRWRSGLNSGSTSAHRWTPVHSEYTLRQKTKSSTGEKNVEEVSQSLLWWCVYWVFQYRVGLQTQRVDLGR